MQCTQLWVTDNPSNALCYGFHGNGITNPTAELPATLVCGVKGTFWCAGNCTLQERAVKMEGDEVVLLLNHTVCNL